eukprot:Skav225441  [mRNA]  locus=scaffold1668:152878:154113:- [translate_table: standard]
MEHLHYSSAEQGKTAPRSPRVRLQEQSMLLDHGRTCQRREFDVLPRGAQARRCGGRPVGWSTEGWVDRSDAD